MRVLKMKFSVGNILPTKARWSLLGNVRRRFLTSEFFLQRDTAPAHTTARSKTALHISTPWPATSLGIPGVLPNGSVTGDRRISVCGGGWLVTRHWASDNNVAERSPAPFATPALRRAFCCSSRLLDSLPGDTEISDRDETVLPRLSTNETLYVS